MPLGGLNERGERILDYAYAAPGDTGGPPGRPARPGTHWVREPLGAGSYAWRLYADPQSQQAQSAGTTPASTTTATPFPQIPDFGLPDLTQLYQTINQMQQQAFQQAEANRIPGQGGLEAESTSQIQQLLNPPAFYPEVDRRSAETAALLGVPGEAAASDARNIRMTREEQLRDIGLGQQFLTAALGRHPISPQFDPSGLANYLAQLPGERARLQTQQQQFAQSQAQQRELALAQMENAFRLAQLQALRGGGALRGSPSYGYGGFPQGVTYTPTAPRPFPMPTPTVTPTFSEPSFPDVNQAFPQIPFNRGWDVPLDIPIDFDALAEPESLYA